MAKDKAFREAEKKIEDALRSGATELDLGGMKLTALPESLGQLTQLQTLHLTGNQLTALPEWLGQLTQLQTLHLSVNQLTALPEWLGQLTQLQELYLSDNQLTALPESLGQLTQLQALHLSGNQLTALPESLGQLTQLQTLNLSGNQLTALPESLGQLTQLQQLHLQRNQLTALPESLGDLTSLNHFDVSGNQLIDVPGSLVRLTQISELNLGDDADGRNPLHPELARAYELSKDAVFAYLHERAKGTRHRYEAKLLILGDGEEGKTCVSRALRGLDFKDQPTTRGVDVEQWPFPHPDTPDDEQRNITLNIWDFEGQEINHQTHQFFLTTESLYVLVFKCREQFRPERAEYWLDTIRARAPGSQVAIVITECEQRTPHLPEDRLQAEYGDLLRGDQWLFAVGCDGNIGVPALQEALIRRAADLPYMGRDWPNTYDAAETQVEEQAENCPHVSRTDLYGIFEEAGVDPDGYDEAARSLERLGVLTQFPDCPDLKDFIVLEPQWLTKAISHIMEDAQLKDDQGEITFERMQQQWETQGYVGLFPTFHNCMREFELCFDLEDKQNACLVPLRFGYLRPQIPWSDIPNGKERRVEYRLNIRPPMGLMSRFIVKTHHLIAQSDEAQMGVYWHNGVFLRLGDGPLRSEALCEFLPEDRTLRITVRAAFPQKMLDQIGAYAGAVFSFFQGLHPERSYGCITVDEETNQETQCPAMHREKLILLHIQDEDQVSCADGWHKVDPLRLITGIASFGGDIETVIREEAARTRKRLEETPRWAQPFIHNIGVLLDWADRHQQRLDQLLEDQQSLAPELRQELELKLREYLGHMSDMLDERSQKSAPSVFSIGTKDGKRWNPKTYFRKKYVLTPWCECEGEMHRHDAGQIEFPTNRDWWDKTAPWIARGTKVLATGLQFAFAGMPLALGDEVYGVVKNDVTFMKEFTKHLDLAVPTSDTGRDLLRPNDSAPGEREHVKDVRGKDSETSLTRAALTRFLEELAPNNYRAGQWGELKRTRLPDNSFRWLCEEHARAARR